MNTRATMTRLGRIDRELAERVSLERALASQAWEALGRTVAEALEPYPQARQAVAAALEALRAGTRQ